MTIEWPTREQLVQRFLGWTRVFFPNVSTAERSDAWLEGQAVGGMAGTILSRVKQIYLDMFPSTAVGDALDLHGFVRLPEDKRRQAASGTTSGQVTATGAATPIPANTEFVHADGSRYKNPTDVTVADWAGGSVDFDVLSVTTGVIANKAEGEILTFVSPIAGIDDDVTVTTGHALDGARDEETDSEYRARILSWYRYPPGGGNYGHYKNYAEGVGACVKAFVYPQYRGLGTIDVVCLGPGRSEDSYLGDRFNVDEDAIWTELDTEIRPCTADIGDLPSAGPTIAITEPVSQSQPIDVDITAAPRYGADFAVQFTATGMPSASKINLGADPTGIILIGHRVIFNVQVGAIWYPEIREVSNVGNPWIEVSEPFSSATHDPVANGVKPGSAGAEAQLEALLDLFDSLTPGDTITGTRRPEVDPDNPTDLLIADIIDSLQSLPSVANVSVTTPALDVTPAAPKNLIRNSKIYINYV